MSLKSDIRAVVGPKNCLDSPVVRGTFAFDSSPFRNPPELVVFPQSTLDVSKVIQIARQHGKPVVPRGAGTGLSGGAVPIRGGVLMVLTRMNHILDVDEISETALVEAGVVNKHLQTALEPFGYMFAPDPASQRAATIGGNVAENAGGMRGVKYGVTKNHILGLELVLSDGAVVCTGMLSQEAPSGPDSSGVFIGSEGTLGVVTKALVKMTRLPDSLRTATAIFRRVEHAAQAVSKIIGCGIVPIALELMDQILIRAVDDFLHIGLPREAEALLLIELGGYETELDGQLGAVLDICRGCGADSVESATGKRERDRLWQARQSGNGALGRIKPALMVQDVTVPRHRLPELLNAIQRIGEKHRVTIAQMAHAGDGNAHPHLLYNPGDPDEHQRVCDASRDIFSAAIALGGTLTGEHGIGLEKQDFMGMQFSIEDLNFMQKVRGSLDPGSVFNPGKIFPEGNHPQ
jgi:glycolate oxidase